VELRFVILILKSTLKSDGARDTTCWLNRAWVGAGGPFEDSRYEVACGHVAKLTEGVAGRGIIGSSGSVELESESGRMH